MAGDWIKVRTDLATSPKVVRMASALNADRFRTVGALHAVWCLFDAHSEDGHLEGYSVSTVDELIGYPGFSSAMVAVGWLIETATGLELPRFEDHNGASAKRRAMEADRKRTARASASDADKKRTREEKRRDKDQHNSKGASGPDESPEPEPEPEPDPLAPSEMYLSWKPDPVQLKAYAFAAAIGLDAFTDEAIGVFTCHYTPSGRIETHATWVSLLVKWVKRDRTYTAQGNVRPFPNKQSAAPDYHSNNTDWADDLGVL